MAHLDRHGEADSRPVVYPESDGEPIGETDEHITAILYLRQALRWLLRAVPDVYVAANMLFYFEEGDPTARRAPDVFAVKGIAKKDRRTYKLWEERVSPCTVIELTSRSSRLEDVGAKRALYEMLGVAEYLLFDPLGEYLDPRFKVFQLVGGAYQPVPLEEGGVFVSQALGIPFRPEGPLLRVLDPLTGAPVPLFEEAARRADEEIQRAESEARRADGETRRADGEARRADEEARRARAAIQRAEELEEELRRLRARAGDRDPEH